MPGPLPSSVDDALSACDRRLKEMDIDETGFIGFEHFNQFIDRARSGKHGEHVEHEPSFKGNLLGMDEDCVPSDHTVLLVQIKEIKHLTCSDP